ncbi:hypothetical protein AAEO57_13255 [Flavobacterium sp. DGU38]|uniref:Uncharacterized protein n=1 Tax=Flavobacterium calami TaxID=3139144 RepID=A0ABU9IQT4_9FLAO
MKTKSLRYRIINQTKQATIVILSGVEGLWKQKSLDIKILNTNTIIQLSKKIIHHLLL